jgi:hypothetical protein
MSYRDIVAFDRTPMQQSMAVDRSDYDGVYRVYKPMLGVILEVHPCDNEEHNRTAIKSKDRRGFAHEATVLIVDDGTDVLMTLENVVIPPDAPSGVDDFCERLPRGSTGLTSGQAMNPALHGVDPYELDGDWCVVGFIGGHVDRPYVQRWWPHARNTYDPATSGAGNPDADGVGTTFVQDRRYYRRVNGVETVVTGEGDVVLSTSMAGGAPMMGKPATKGRFARTEVADGGNVRVYIKPSACMEWVWDSQEEGIGPMGGHVEDLPQTNPGTVKSVSDQQNTFFKVNSTDFAVTTPETVRFTTAEASVTASESILAKAPEITNETSVNFSVDSQGQISLSATALLELVTQAVLNLQASGAINITAGGALALGGSSVVIAPSSGAGSISATPTGVSLGTGATEAAIRGTVLAASLGVLATGLAAVPAAVSPPTTQVLAEANRTAILAIITAIGSSLSATVKVA